MGIVQRKSLETIQRFAVSKVTPYLILVSLFFSVNNSIAKTIEEGIYVKGNTKETIKLVKQHPDLTLDHPSKNGVEVFGPKGTISYIQSIFSNTVVLEEDYELISNTYPTSKQIESQLFAINKSYPKLTSLQSLGKTHEGNDIWCLKISDNVNEDELEPEVKYIANMHGNEIVGRELMILFIKDILSGYKKNDPQAVKLINNLEIYIVPSMNPDGADKKRRGNARWIDLNRDFPDFSTSDNDNNPEGREPETQAIMKFQASRHFSLSANFHGGAEVVNYPWDTVSDEHPLHEMVLQTSLNYASLVPGMRDSTEFPRGVVNGYDWYEVNGGMQDWSYHWHKDLQVTVELSNSKYPDYSQVDNYWQQNRASLYNFLEVGITGIGIDNPDNHPLNLRISKNRNLVFESKINSSQFFKTLDSGAYEVIITNDDGNLIRTKIIVSDNATYISIK